MRLSRSAMPFTFLLSFKLLCSALLCVALVSFASLSHASFCLTPQLSVAAAPAPTIKLGPTVAAPTSVLNQYFCNDIHVVTTVVATGSII